MSGAVASGRLSALGLRTTVLGAVMQLLGLGLDAFLHGRDPTLGSRESVFSLANEGHLLLLGGLVLVGTGVTALLVHSLRGPEEPGRSLPLGHGAAVAVTALLLSGTAAAAATRMGDSHHPPIAGDEHAAVGEALTAPHSGRRGHGVPGEVPAMDAATTATLDLQLEAARGVAARYPRVADALADGYSLAAPYESLIGSHYLRFAEVDTVFDVSRPEMLLFDGDAAESRLVGLSYYVVGSVAPDGFAGEADRWHQHVQTCLTPDGPAFAGDGYRLCRASGRNSWMLHAWVVAGRESPHGVFSDENARLS